MDTLLQILLPVLLVLHFMVLSSRSSGAPCFAPKQGFIECTKDLGLPNFQVSASGGYEFGYGSLNETEEMCRTQHYITVLKCMREKAQRSCPESGTTRFYRIIWDFTLDVSRYERATKYMCEPHNLRIFRSEKNGCLLREEQSAYECTKSRNNLVQQALQELNTQSTHKNPIDYYDRVRDVTNRYECKSLQNKLLCLYTLLYTKCPPNVVRLILNYFIETLPEKCYYEYEYRLKDYLNSKERRRLQLEQNKRRHNSSQGYPISAKNQDVNSDRGRAANIPRPIGSLWTYLTVVLTCMALVGCS